MNFGGLDLTSPINRIRAGMVAIAQNVRAYLSGGFALRNPLTDAIISALPTPVHTIRRLNDSTPNGPASGYTLIIGAGTSLYAWNSTIGLVLVATGLSGNPLSMIPFRPNASVQPWMYVFDSSPAGTVTLITKYLISGSAVNFSSNGMLKVRSDGLCYKMGVKEPQLAPVVSTANSTVAFGGGSGNLLATTIPWTNHSGANTGYNFGESNGFPGTDGTAPFIVNVRNASFVTISSITGTATINGGAATPTTNGPSTSSSTNPGHYVMAIGTGATPPATATVVVGAFTDGSGNVIPAGVAPLFIPSVVDVGAAIGVTNGIVVPFGAVAFQIGINSTGNTYNSNSGSFTIAGTVTTNALPSVTSILGTLQASIFDDSPTSGPVSAYIWKNPDDPGGSGPPRSISDAVNTTTGNSLIFDATFTAGIPALPGIGTPSVPMLWTQLSPESVAIASNALFAAPMTKTNPTNTQFANFNFNLTGSIYFPSGGNYTFVITNHDDFIWGIGGGVSLVSASAINQSGSVSTSIAQSGQTITVVGGYPLLPRGNNTGSSGGSFVTSTVVVSVPSAGIYPIEFGFDYWFHSGRIFLVMASPTPLASATIIPPLPANIRQEVQVRYVYRSSATGAPSNPSPESSPLSIPVTSNTYTSLFSTDPQIDVVDYYRIDSTTADFTYVNTGPNDDLGGGGTNTPVSDSLTDLELGTQLLDFDNFEPFPSIDLPQKGICNVSGGVISWVSGGAIGGTSTGFGSRWLAGTEILIGSPTSLVYTLIARPVSNTITIPDVPDASGVAYYIAEPVLGNQPLPYAWGPTDNINFVHACGDTLRPGTDYWCKGSNLDAAPDTNQQDVTDPSEPLINGAMSGGRSVLGSIRRFWVIMPNFFNDVSTATGTTGDTWTFQETSIDRGLFIPRCLAVEGGGKVFFRVDDGIQVSPGGAASQSITDQTLYPLFKHEGSVPTSITRNGVTFYPPNDAQPQYQKFSIQGSYLYYDYVDTGAVPRTLVFDIGAMSWIWDVTTPAATIHASDEGESTGGVLVGCTDGTVRQFSTAGTETVTGIVMAGAMGGRGYQHAGMIVVEYSSQATVTLTAVVQDSGNGSYGPSSITLPSTGGAQTKYFTRPTANKWKLLSWQFQSTDPNLRVYLDGCLAYTMSWGETSYHPTPMFGDRGGQG